LNDDAVFGAVLRTGQELLAESLVFFDRGSARAGSGEAHRADRCAVHPSQLLGRSSKKTAFTPVNGEHVAIWVVLSQPFEDS